MSSMRARLFLLLTAATGLVWLFAAGWIWISTQRELDRALDARLVEAGRMVASLVAGQRIDPGAAAQLPVAAQGGYGRQLSCQIWSLDGRLLGRSADAPEAALTSLRSGISETVIDGVTWRVFAIEDPGGQARILVGDNVAVRDRLVRDVILGLLLPVALVLPALALLIWLGVGRGLAPLRRIAGTLRTRDVEDLAPLDPGSDAAEIRPVAEALNGLFHRLAAARERERQFIDFAAHELRTPLAGLRTQAQVALAAQEPAMRSQALRQILVSVDRTTRLVRQLLDLSRLDAEAAPPALAVVALGALVVGLQQALEAPCRARDIVLETDAAIDGVLLRVDEHLFATALRNLVENAIQHTPTGGRVRLSLERDGTALAIEDEGAGIPAEELALVTRRFFRGRHRNGLGTGLGLSIAEQALRRCGAGLHLANRTGGGLRAEILLGATRVPADDAAPDAVLPTPFRQVP
ncbi:two-component sensor histidine kinase [Roseomonas frigidaquae]|uniref:histidine kinase n=1 Tax=Falsiroseomonas frigidaquae TaxID=487318 RepID=A0ABX1F1V6_9PROT|nr:ATP-binding protein [Falsiroseomonas frigidaquae]NKE46322.1 two-component sensor histidine kinase [Falsiroseomonas frigidaquae]